MSIRSVLFCISLCVGVYPAVVNATVLVAEINGDAKRCHVRKAGQAQPLPLTVLMGLKHQDVLTVTGADSRVTLLKEDYSTVLVTAANSPYTVNNPDSSTTAWSQVVAWWDKTALSTSSLSAVETFSRGDNDSAAIAALHLQGFDPGINRIVDSNEAVFIRWRGGQAPFTVQLLDAAGQAVIKQQTDQRLVRFSIQSLIVQQSYRLVVRYQQAMPAFNGTQQTMQVMDERRLMVVPKQALAAGLFDGADTDLSETARMRLRAVQLAGKTGWRFQALQWAESYRLEDLRQRLLAQAF